MVKRNKVLVTGGSGFIGSSMIKFLLERGFEVRAFDLPQQFAKNALPKEAEIYKGSILDSNDIMNAMKSCDYVVHLAAMLGVRRVEVKRLDCLNINIQGTTNILEACVRDNIRKIVFASSSEVYGDQGRIPISEKSPLNPKSVYAVTKLAAEEYLKAYKHRYDLNYSIVRFFNVYGPGQVAEFVMPRFIKSVMEDKSPIIYGNGDQVRAFCYVDDAVTGTGLALTNGRADSGIFNIGNDTEPISVTDLALKVISITKKNLKPGFVPIENSDRSAQREIQKRIPDISKARRVLNYEPKVSLSEGILKVIEHGKIEETWFDPTSNDFGL